jgi:hypothetical protein
MRNLRLRAVEDDEYGYIGLKFVIPHKFCNGRFTIQSGAVLAHDSIEHQQGTQKIGSIGDEMIALGGICFTRGQWGDLNRNNHGSIFSTEESIAFDLHGPMANLYFEDGVPFRQKLVKSRDDDPTDFVDSVIECARENWVDRYEPYDEADVLNQEQIDSYLEACRTYMLHGAKLAERRYPSAMMANALFWEIERVTSKLIDQIEYEGQEFVLSYDFSLNVNFNEVNNGDY